MTDKNAADIVDLPRILILQQFFLSDFVYRSILILPVPTYFGGSDYCVSGIPTLFFNVPPNPYTWFKNPAWFNATSNELSFLDWV